MQTFTDPLNILFVLNEKQKQSIYQGYLIPKLVPATSPLEATGRRDLSHEQFTRSVLRNKSQGFVPKIQTSLNSWD